MDSKVPTSSSTSFKELSLDLSPTSGGGIIHIQLPSTSTFGRPSRLTRHVSRAYPRCRSSEDYQKWHVASSSGICFRREGVYPRSILWRCLDSSNVLELRSVDIVRNEAEKKEAGVIFQLAFPQPIRPTCVGLADSEHGDTFNVFVLTKNNDLYTFLLRSSFLYQPEASEGDFERCYQVARPSALSLSQPYKLTYCASNEIVFSLGDARLVHLTRQKGGDGQSWTESLYTDGNWGPSLRGLIRWQGQNSIRYEGMSLDPNTALAARPTPDGKHMVSVTLNHTLKVWNVDTKKPTLTRDLLNVDRDQNQSGKVMLDPGLHRVLALESSIRVAFSGDKYYLLTFTPHEGGSFKIWGARDADFGGNGVRDLFPEETLRIPDPDDGALWTLADFKLIAHSSTDEVSVWIMLRLNRRYKLFHKRFSDLAHVAQEWYNEWEQTSMVAGSTSGKTEDDSHHSEPLCIAVDTEHELPWILLTNAVSLIRSCTETEYLLYNSRGGGDLGRNSMVQSIESDAQPTNSEAAALVDVATQLQTGFEHTLVEDAVRAELWQDPTLSASERIVTFYDRAGMSRVADRFFNDLMSALDKMGGPNSLSTEAFSSIMLQTLSDQLSQPTKLESTAFGRRALVVGAAEMIHLHERIINDLLCVVVFIDQEIDRDEYALKDLNIPRVFEEFAKQLRALQIMRWISSTNRLKDDQPITILEDSFASDIRPQSPLNRSGSVALTDSIRDLIKWISGGNDTGITMDEIAVNIQCNLLANDDITLATSFLRYLPSTAWATYIRARHSLLCRNFVSAAIYFQKAAFIMSRKQPASTHYSTASAGFLSPNEAGYLASGLGNYYAHVANLFSAPHIYAHAQVAQFASLALQHLPSHSNSASAVDAASGKSQSLSSSSRRSDVLARLFHSSISLGDFDAAFSALERYSDSALRKAALKELVTVMLAAGAASELIALPFSTALKPEVDSLLTDMVRKESEAGGKESSSSYSSSSAYKAVKVLYAWKVQQGDYRGAAACVMEKLRVQSGGGKHSKKRRQVRMLSSSSGENDDGGIMDDYLIALNALSLLGGEPGVEDGENEGWVFMEKTGDPDKSRSLVRLRDLRRDYQDEMDIREKWERGRFALTAGDSDEDDAMEM